METGQNSQIASDIMVAADWIAKALNSSGYNADFSVESLQEIDRFFDDHSANGKPKPGGLLAEQTGARLFSLGAYTGEVLRREYGGQWHGDDADPEVEINVELRLNDGSTVWPMQRTLKRLVNGQEDSIHHYGLALKEPIKKP